MSKYNRYRHHPDPEYQRWGRAYRSFPGVVECVRLILNGKATGAWADVIAFELAENASDCLAELIDAFHEHTTNDVAVYVMIALEMAAIPESVDFLSDVLQQGDPRFISYARHTLQAINTREARSALFHATHAEQSYAADPAAGPVSNEASSPSTQ
ncbi:MAG: hypothetical protein MI924_34680 [Chloroflexales bacterium]|nr:hypothetical protein [Chloroflexales bacterium]